MGHESERLLLRTMLDVASHTASIATSISFSAHAMEEMARSMLTLQKSQEAQQGQILSMSASLAQIAKRVGAVESRETEEPFKEEEPPQGALSGRLVVVVDDLASLAAAISRFLKDSGAIVLEAHTSEDATRQMVPHGRMDAAVIDFHLTDGDGIELGRWVRQRWAHCQIILMTGDRSMLLARHEEVVDLQAHILDKPFSPAELLRLLCPDPSTKSKTKSSAG